MKKIILCLIITLNINAQSNWYVSTTGTNTSTGGSFSAPFKTVTYAATKASPGDTILVMGGTYTNTTYGTYDIWKVEQTVRINNFNPTGIPNYLTIKPYNNQAVKFKGDGDIIFQIRNSSYITVQGFEIEGEVNNIPLDSALKYQFCYKDVNGNIQYRVPPNTPPSVVATMTFNVLSNVTRTSLHNALGLLAQNSHHINMYNNHVHHLPGTGLRAFQCDYVNVKRNAIHDNSRRSSVGNHGLVFHSSKSIDNADTAKIFISDNKVHHNYNEVYSWSELKTFITPHIDEGKGISMQKNTWANGWHHGIIRIENNLAYFNGFSGVHVNEGVRFDIFNNTCYYNSFSGGGINIGISAQGGDTIRITNNISVTDPAVNGFAISTSGGVGYTVSNNVIIGSVDTDITNIATNTYTSTNTLFTNPTTFNFSLLSGTIPINNGLSAFAPQKDFFGTQRDAMPDIGAVEYTMLTTIIELNENEKLLYPNPANKELCVYGNITSVVNVLGADVIQQIKIERDANKNTLDVSRLTNGIYFIFTEKENYKFIKQ